MKIVILFTFVVAVTAQEVIPIDSSMPKSSTPSTTEEIKPSPSSSTAEPSRNEYISPDFEIKDKPPCYPPGINSVSNFMWSLKPENIRSTLNLLLTIMRRNKPCEPFLPDEPEKKPDDGTVNEDSENDVEKDFQPTFIQRVSSAMNLLRSMTISQPVES